MPKKLVASDPFLTAEQICKYHKYGEIDDYFFW
jgi:hypothetical protein